MVITRNGKQIHFKEGQLVQIRQWNDMASEFKVNEKATEIRCAGVFISRMLHLCGEKARINCFYDGNTRVLLDFNNVKGSTDFVYSIDMVEPIK